MTEYILKYTTSEDNSNDTSWHETHGYGIGWFWNRPSDDAKIFAYELDSVNIKFSDFPNLDSEKIEELVSRFTEARRIEEEKRRKYLEKNPIKFENFTMPKFKNGFPNLDINDIVGVEDGS